MLIFYKVGRIFARKIRIENSRFVAYAQKYLHKKLKSSFAIVQGHRMYLDSEDSLNLSLNGIYEALETKTISDIVSKGDIVLDIGANIGYYTLILARLVGNGGKVYAFEPDPSNFALLKKNVAINQYKNVVLINKAVSDKEGDIPLYLDNQNKGGHRLFAPKKPSHVAIEVESIFLDSFFLDKDDNISFIKMDIEGAEFNAIKGMYNLLSSNDRIKILTEFSPGELTRSGVRPVKFLKLLNSLGFKLYKFNNRTNGVSLIDVRQWSKYACMEEGTYMNILCKH